VKGLENGERGVQRNQEKVPTDVKKEGGGARGKVGKRGPKGKAESVHSVRGEKREGENHKNRTSDGQSQKAGK